MEDKSKRTETNYRQNLCLYAFKTCFKITLETPYHIEYCIKYFTYYYTRVILLSGKVYFFV